MPVTGKRRIASQCSSVARDVLSAVASVAFDLGLIDKADPAFIQSIVSAQPVPAPNPFGARLWRSPKPQKYDDLGDPYALNNQT
jgi:hypothetical protein